ncbi:MAG: alpha/beta hydrolase [Rhizobiales bacterium]|nr:alpha/beta hydrolase [Hyphomicrobiales bacterium]
MKLELRSRLPAVAKHATPLLFVHGAWHGAWCWDENFLSYFADRGFAAHALSLRNHGESETVGSLRWKRIRDYVADVESIAADLPRKPAIIGHSMGGFVTQHYLQKHDPPAAVLLASVPPNGVFHTTLKLAARHPLAFLKANATWSLYPFIADPNLAKEAFFSKALGDSQVESYWRQMKDESWLAFLDMLALDLPKPTPSKTPPLVIGGATDTIFSVADAEATARAYGTVAEIFPDTAHDMMLEPRWRDVAARIADWLDSKLAAE